MAGKSFLDNVPKGVFIAGGLFVLVSGVAFIGYILLAPSDKGGSSSAKVLTPKSVSSTVGGEGTPAYNQMIDELNRKKALDASQKGDSFIPIPVGDEKPVEQVAPKPPKVVITPPPKSTPPPVQKKVNNKAWLADLKGLMAKNKQTKNEPVVMYVALDDVQLEEAALRNKSDAASFQVAPPLNKNELNILQNAKPGDVLYAINDIAVNTDASSPVMATVAMGPLKGSKVMGAFQRQEENVVIAFSRIISPSGETINCEAVAIDPQTSSAAIASKVDTHFFSRWGSLVAASFVEGFGGAMSNRKKQVYSTGDVVVESTDKSYTDVSLEALGKVGGRVASQIERNFDRPPTVYVNAGEPLGVLIISIGKK